MADVVPMIRPVEKVEPHLAGLARCLACHHEWSAVAPMPCREMLECPSCGCFRGVFKHEVVREGDRFECFCGNFYFIIASRGTYCPNCGDWMNFPGHGRAG
jgi:hypothetical protein